MNSEVKDITRARHATAEKDKPITPIDTALLGDVEIVLEARLGEGRMTVASLLTLKSGSMVELTTSIADHAGLYLNDKLVARGEIVAVGDKFGVRITELGSGD
jgi:flagellar motor switch protein FliN